MPEFTIRTTITGTPDALAPFRQQFINLFPIVETDTPGEIVTILSGGNLDPRPTLLNLSVEFPTLTFSIAEHSGAIGEMILSNSWTLRDGSIMRDGRDR